MSEGLSEEKREELWDALQRKVCTVCLDARDDGTCGLNRVCAMERHFQRVIDAVSKIQSPRMDEYYAVLEREVCANCAEQDPEGNCARRDNAECALNSFLPLVVEAIEEVLVPGGKA